MKNRWLTGVLLAAGMALATSATAGEAKIGYVDLMTAVKNTKSYNDGMRNLENFKNRRQKELDDLGDQITKMENGIQAQSMAMSPDKLAQKQVELNDLRKTYNRKKQDAEEELQRKNNELVQEVMGNFYAVVEQYAKQNGFEMVLHKGPAVIYGAASHDLTDEITKALDAKKSDAAPKK